MLILALIFTGCEDPTYKTAAYDNTYNYDYTLLAWSQESIHAIESDHSVLVLGVPYTTINAQLVKKGSEPDIVTSGVTLTYEPIANSDGTINTTSANKTNFWSYITALFNVTKAVDTGLADKNFSTSMSYNSTTGRWEARGIPLVARDDTNSTAYYPTFKVTATLNGSTIAHTQVVTAVSDEQGCVNCHQALGFRNDAGINDTGKTTLQIQKLGILELHDARHAEESLVLSSQSAPVACASCHSSVALGMEGVTQLRSKDPLARALHGSHASDRVTLDGSSLAASTDDSACTACHASAKDTHDKRDSMHANAQISCQNCHGALQESIKIPKCANCHQSGTRHTSAFSSGTTLRAIAIADTIFNNDTNFSLAKGHENMQCNACHGTSHTIGVSNRADDTFQSRFWQGEAGTLFDCLACHTTMPLNLKGPHGMHGFGQGWMDDDAHGETAEDNINACKVCHGSDLRGSILSRTFEERALSKRTYAKGQMVGCYDCHGQEW